MDIGRAFCSLGDRRQPTAAAATGSLLSTAEWVNQCPFSAITVVGRVPSQQVNNGMMCVAYTSAGRILRLRFRRCLRVVAGHWLQKQPTSDYDR
ncbi:hypothetical protein GOP47_0018513 [Adiantum capillus-veneris]|uniref:Uncharacterized protein n=1 Tax=Adiantum capillus-veneris TaxID=13818 RepID=A0A9D4Z8U8_ADICA|nr:hypothetical protein GOP47_0018513 [Adiantum capillus-veneris]